MATVKHHAHFPQEIFSSRTKKSNGCIKVSLKRASLSSQSESGAKRANLSARKKESVNLPNYGRHHISEFFSHPSGIEAILNTRALQSYHSLDSNLYRCVLPQIQLLNFRFAPVLDLLVTPSTEDCLVEMLSCKFDGSEVVQRQNERFSASMRNHINWETIDAEHVLDVDVELSLALEIHTQPFTMLPISAVEVPGNIMFGDHRLKSDASSRGPAGTVACETVVTRLREMDSSTKQMPSITRVLSCTYTVTYNLCPPYIRWFKMDTSCHTVHVKTNTRV